MGMSIREVVSKARENQILFMQYGPSWKGLCQVKQIIRKAGHDGETLLTVRFLGSDKFHQFGWRNPHIFNLRVMSLEDLEEYFARAFRVLR